jgi:hypothetical protein
VYYLMIRRVVRHARGRQPGEDRYAARSDNVLHWEAGGPFTSAARAERAALAALATHTCLTALVLDAAGMERLASDRDTDYQLARAVRSALKFSPAH